MNFLAHLHLAHLADSSLSGNLLADFVRGNPASSFAPEVVDGIFMHRRIDVMTDNLPEVREAKEWFRSETRRVAPITLDVMWDHFLSRHWAEISPDFPLAAFVRYAHTQVATILPESPPRFVNLNNYMWSEKWLERYQDMDFIQMCSMAWPAAARVSMPCATRGMTWTDITTRWKNASGVFIRR